MIFTTTLECIQYLKLAIQGLIQKKMDKSYQEYKAGYQSSKWIHTNLHQEFVKISIIHLSTDNSKIELRDL